MSNPRWLADVLVNSLGQVGQGFQRGVGFGMEARDRREREMKAQQDAARAAELTRVRRIGDLDRKEGLTREGWATQHQNAMELEGLRQQNRASREKQLSPAQVAIEAARLGAGELADQAVTPIREERAFARPPALDIDVGAQFKPPQLEMDSSQFKGPALSGDTALQQRPIGGFDSMGIQRPRNQEELGQLIAQAAVQGPKNQLEQHQSRVNSTQAAIIARDLDPRRRQAKIDDRRAGAVATAEGGGQGRLSEKGLDAERRHMAQLQRDLSYILSQDAVNPMADEGKVSNRASALIQEIAQAQRAIDAGGSAMKTAPSGKPAVQSTAPSAPDPDAKQAIAAKLKELRAANPAATVADAIRALQ